MPAELAGLRHVHARNEEARLKHPFVKRGQKRRTDPILATLIDVAIAYRDNLGCRVAQAFLRETGVSEALAKRVLDGAASKRSTSLRRSMPRAVHGQATDRV